MAEQEFIKAGFTVVGTEASENKLLSFLKENYPNIIRDTEINLEELKSVLGLPIDEKVNGYGLNFVGRNFSRAKYAQKTEKEFRLNDSFSKDIETTQNLVLKGDNLDSLKILKNHYSGQIKCIYIDPPYNQHPYGSNYFMLNLINNYVRPREISKVSGIPIDWNRSPYNKKGEVMEVFSDLVSSFRAKYLLISYNSEGFITPDQMMHLLAGVGKVERMETQYNTFRGSRNLRNRNAYTKEFLFLVTKEG